MKLIDGIEAIFELAPLQEGMLFHTLYAPESSVYNLQFEFALEGELEEAALETAWRLLVDRHAALRTSFVWQRVDKPYQMVHRRVDLKIRRLDWRGMSATEQAAHKQAWLEEDRCQRFDLARPLLMRLALIVLSPSSYRLVWTFHHIVLEGWSAAIILSDLWKIYGELRAGRSPDLPPPPPYQEFIQWLRKQDLGSAEAYWRKALRGFKAAIRLPSDRSNSSAPAAVKKVRMCDQTLAEGFSRSLRSFARTHRLTLNTIIQGAWALLLSRYSGESDVVFGAVVSGRPAELPDAASTVGLFVNTLPARVEVSSDRRVVRWLEQVQRDQASMRQYEYSPLARVQTWSELPGGQPLFHTALAFENWLGDFPSGQVAPGLHIVETAVHEASDQPLALFVSVKDAMTLKLGYDAERFDHAATERMLAHLQTLLEGMVAAPERRIAELPLLTEVERHQLLVEWNQTDRDYPRDACVHQLFEEWVERSADSVALVFEGQELRYGQLNARANQLARHLSKCGVTVGTLVGVCMERGIEWITAILGIFKAGAIYMPLDPGYPESRLRVMLEDSGVTLVLTHGRLTGTLSSYQGGVLQVDSDWPRIAGERAQNLRSQATAESPAYVIYTSGSTGKPKGALLEHRGLCNLAAEQIRLFGVGPGSRVLQFSSPNFDASLFDIVMALASGGTLVLALKEQLLPGPSLSRLLREQRIAILTIPPSSLDVLTPEPLPDLKTINVAGEPCPAQLVSRWAPGRDFYNLYGPTECTIWATATKCVADGGTPHIGRPIANTQVYVLDPQGHPVPVGVTGELFIGGVGVGKGYLNRPELTGERFRSDNFSTKPGARLYRTGDLVRYRSDGNLEFVGRIDEQVKVRGYRVELGEVEAVLTRHSVIREAVVLAREDAPGDKRLVAYVTAKKTTADLGAELRAHLRQQLPDYMVPSAFIVLDALPLNPNGKLDRKALPAPSAEQGERNVIAPGSELEQRIAAVWREVLQVEQIGVTDNFFDLGGHSLLLVKVHVRLCAELNCELKMVDLFTYPTIEALARYLGQEAQVSVLAQDASARVNRRRDAAKKAEPIAIIAMAGRFPGAGDIESFWQNLRQGKESIAFFSAEEMRACGVPEAMISDPNYVPARGYLEDADKFDAGLFGYSAREAQTIDPQQRLLLECAAEVLERAGYDPERYHGLIGVYAGASINSYSWTADVHRDLLASPGGLSEVLASGQDFLTTRVSYKLNLRGPSVNVQTACSTSLVAVHQACRALWDYECDMALAGGVSVTTPLKSGHIYVQQGICSPDGHCRAFDAGANGTVGGNGVAMVMLKRLSEALADGDHIHAVIPGTAINNDGSSKVGYTAPSVEGQAQAIALAQAAAQFDPDTIGYVETHGTGTLLGDPIEIAALTRVFGHGRRRSSPCWIGSLKTNVGHLDAAAGVAGLIKAALSLEHKELVPSLHFSKPNPQIDFAAGPFRVNTELQKWESPQGAPRRAGVSSFGLGGTNAHVVLEEAPALEPSGASRDWQVLCLSAKTDAALAQAKANLARHLSAHPDINLADAAYTLQLGRREFAHRCVVVCRNAAEAVSALQGSAPARLIGSVHKGAERSVVFMFSGQGAQYPNMGLGLYRSEALFREIVDQCCERLKRCLGLDLREVLFPVEDALEQAAERLKRTELTQPALFVIEYALAKLWMSLGIKPAAMIGHSIGEYVAACLAGVMSLDDALDLVAERGRLMGQLPPGSMLAVPLSEAEVLPLLGEQLSLASINSPTLCVVSGPQAEIAALEARLIQMELAPRRLHTSHAFHSPMMDPILEPFTKRASKITLKPPQLPYISNVTGEWITAEQATDPAHYANHLRQAVQFSAGIKRLLQEGDYCFVEVGPGNALATFVRQHSACGPDRPVLESIRHPRHDQSDMAFILTALGRLWLSGKKLAWSKLHDAGRRKRIALPTYPFERKRFWIETPSIAASPSPGGSTLAITKIADVEQWCHVPVWKSALAFDINARDDASLQGRWLIFTDESGFGERIAAAVEQRGGQVIRAGKGPEFTRRSHGKYLLHPGSREEYDRLLGAAEFGSAAPQRVVHAWSLGAEQGHESELQRGFYSILFLTQAVMKRWPAARMHLDVITEGAMCVGGDEALIPARATAQGLCRVIPQELPSISCRSIDLELRNSAAAEQERLLCTLLGELGGVDSAPVVAYRHQRRWVQTFEKVSLKEHAGKSRLRQQGVYLITGGLGAVGLVLAAHLAKSVKARLILTGRSELPHRSAWEQWLLKHGENDRTSRKLRKILALEDTGAEVMLAAGDVANRADMRRLVAAATQRFGAIHGVIHAAGVVAGPSFKPIEDLTTDDCETQFRPKVRGLMVLQELFDNQPVDFVMAVSSLSSVLGGLRFGAYAAANHFMDVMCHQRHAQRAVHWLSVNWDGWRIEEQDAQASRNGSVAALAMTPEEGVAAFDRAMRLGMVPQVAISTADLSARLAQWVVPQRAAEDTATVPRARRHERPQLSTEHVAPANETEQDMVAIWQDLFNIEKIGARDNFFELGGHSLLALQAVSRVRDRLGVGLTIEEFMELGSIEKISAHLGARRWVAQGRKGTSAGGQERHEFEA